MPIYMIIPGKEQSAESLLILRLETMGYGPLENILEPVAIAAEPVSAPRPASALPNRPAGLWTDLAALAEFVWGIGWLTAEQQHLRPAEGR
jgi:hypothetical protein